MGTVIPHADRRAAPVTWTVTEAALRRRIAELEAQTTQLSIGKELAERALAVKDSLLDALRARVAELEQGHVAVNVELEAANGRVAELERQAAIHG